jgi:intracellular multiplication protein IcmE
VTEPQIPPSNEPIPESPGFEAEGTVLGPADPHATRGPEPGTRPSRGAQLAANFKSVFGHGMGKVGLLAVGLFVVLAVAFAVREFSHPEPAVQTRANQVDVPTPPLPKVSVEPIDSKEADRRAQRALLEADGAQRRGQTYQPDFTPSVTRRDAARVTPVGLDTPPVPPDVAVKASNTPVNVAVPNAPSPAVAAALARQSAQEDQRHQVEVERQRTARDKYVDELRNGVKAQIEDLVGDKGGLRSVGGYTVVRYLPPDKPGTAESLTDLRAPAPAALSTNIGEKQLLFRAGSIIFATLDSEVNTDDGGDVFATVQGGPYANSRLIGKIEQAPRNIRLHFSVLAPQDERPTLSINAIAIREQDAKEGVADSVNHHVIERYTALFAGSLLQGLGQAAAQPQGTAAVLPNGQTIVEQQQVSNKRIAMYALGSVGTNAGAQVRQTFSEPLTYKTPANKGIGVIFLTDVSEK